MQRLAITLLTLLSSLCLTAQETLAVGEWDDYLPYRAGKWVTQSSSEVFYATDLSLLSIDKSDLSPKFIGKLEGLSDVGVERIAYDDFNEQLIIVYTNSNIDIYTDFDVVNIPDINTNSTIVGSKRILDIHVFDESSAFFASGFGIVELNTQTLEFGSTIFTELQVNDISSAGNQLYAATTLGIFTIAITENTNIADFSRWELLGESVGLPDSVAVEWVETAGANIYAVVDEEIYASQAGDPFVLLDSELLDGNEIAFLSKGNNNRVLIGTEQSAPRSQVLSVDEALEIRLVNASCVDFVRYAVQDQGGRYWYAEQFVDFRYSNEDGTGCNRRPFPTPRDEKVSDVAILGDLIFVATGGVEPDNGFQETDNFSGMYQLSADGWADFNSGTFEPIRDAQFINLYQVEAHPTENKIYLGSFFSGILEYDLDTGETQHFDQESSCLQGTVGDAQREKVSGLSFDPDGNLWVNTFGAPQPLVVYTPEGDCLALSVTSSTNMANCIATENGYIWSLLAGGSNGVHVYDPSGTPLDPTDDQQRTISASNSEIESSVTALAEDLDGQVWVGTTSGPIVFDGGANIFESDNRGNRRRVVQDSIVAFLLETEDIRAIAVDGANRKWFGTRNGVFVQSPDGEIQIAHFTAENSPLFNNTITTLQYDGKTGRMYIGTVFGLQVYRTETLAARNTHSTTVYAFPNPVRPDYEGPIFIKGLARDADVKITDLNGKLVYETEALGGLASWDGRDYNGRRAVSGVYLVFSTGTQSFDTPDAFVTKILLIN